MGFTTEEIELMLAALRTKRDIIASELNNLDLLISKTENSVINNYSVDNNNEKQRRRRDSESKIELYNKIEFILKLAEQPITSREILQEIYSDYEDFDQSDDRKNIAAVSSILYTKVAEKKIHLIKKDREQARFSLVEGSLDSELNKLNEEYYKQHKKVILDNDEDELPF